MRYFACIILFTTSVLSCTSNDRAARNIIEDYIKANADDANSYEFIGMNKPDTLRITDTLEHGIFLDSLYDLNLALQQRKPAQQALSDYEKLIDGPYSYIYRQSYERYKKEVTEYNKSIMEITKSIDQSKKKIKELKANPSQNSIIRISYKLNCRLKNKLGILNKIDITVCFFPKENKWGEVTMSK